MKNTHNKSESEILRQKAEELLKKKSAGTASPFSEVESIRLIHELKVHQVELEMQNDELQRARAIAEVQNDELQRARAIAEVANDKYIRLYDFAPSGYFTLSDKGEIIELNLSGAKMLGKDRQHLKNSLLRFFVSEETKPIFNRFLEKAFNGKVKESCDVTLLQDGNLPMYGHLTGIVYENGEQCLVTMVDITERKQAEDLLQQTRHNFETFFNTIDEFLFVLDEQGNIIQTNSAVIDRLGYTREELIGISILMVHPTERRDEAAQFIGEILSGVSEFCLIPIETKSGVQIPVETRVSQGVWDGKPTLFGVSKDISQIRLSEEKFSKLFHLNPSACSLSDLATRQYIEVNEAFYNMLGFDKIEVIGKTATDLNIFTQEKINAILMKADSNGNVTNAEAELMTKNGDIKQVLISAENTHVQDKEYRLTVIHDITARKKAEDEIKLKNDELFKLNAEKDKFFSIISHDLRGPFNGFLGLTKLMAEELPTLKQQDIQKIATSMRDSATNLFNLLENLLEWSRLQRGITSFEPGPLLLMPMIAESMHPVIDLADKKGVEIRYEIQTDLEVFADEYMLASTIRNLASNAVKFTTKGGKVTIAAKTIPGNSVEISFMDTGIGMNSKTVADLFRIDVQTNRKGTENEPSSGLGLLLCKDFVEKHGGKLWVESEEGKGSVFYFTIPDNAKGLMKNVITNSVSNEEKEVQIKRMKILIAEDDEISASLISAMVEKYSHQVLHAKTGVDAVHACRNNPDIDLVLMDINLTGMDGFEATRQIRQFNKEVIIIAQTAFSLKFDRVMAIEAGCSDYINKPISISGLHGLIRKYFTE
jgi:PAS domain S-box-containing protein